MKALPRKLANLEAKDYIFFKYYIYDLENKYIIKNVLFSKINYTVQVHYSCI
jgi:hypothetical protein